MNNTTYQPSITSVDSQHLSNKALLQNQPRIFQQKIQKYVDETNEFYESFVLFLKNTDDFEQDFQDLINIINKPSEEQGKPKIEHLLLLIASIADNHHRNESFFDKIFKILQYLKEQIQQTFSNFEIFNIFKSNKVVLLLLFESGIITVDNQICNELINIREANGNRYCHFFYPEINKFVSEQQSQSILDELLAQNPDIFNNFDEKRHKGENDSTICTLIRNDSAEDFIAYMNHGNIPLNSFVKTSIFETNKFLIEKETTLIEYSAFFGATQIFNYLQMSNVKLTQSLWFYAIHSQYAEMIHLLESLLVGAPVSIYEKCYLESIICHHNEFAEYFKNNKLYDESIGQEMKEIIFSNTLKCHNYAYFPTSFNNDYEFFYLCCFNFMIIANNYMLKNEKHIMKQIKQKIPLTDAASKNKIEVLYCLLLMENEIKNDLFSENLSVKRIVIPPSIRSIGINAFYKCEKLENVSIPSSVILIGEKAFAKCTSIKQIIIPFSVISIGNYAFVECTKLTSISIPASVVSIGDNVFEGCTSLMQVYIPSSVRSIGCNAFEKCSSLTEISIPSSVTIIKKYTFYQCSKLESVIIPSSIVSIESGAFFDCSSIEEIIIPSSVKSIGNSCFNGCSKLKKISIPSSVTSFGTNVFGRIGSFEIVGEITCIPDKLFENCTQLKQITLPSTITSIGNSAFAGCSSLEEFIIPSSVISVGARAFARCVAMTEVVIQGNLKSIAEGLFQSCSKLAIINIPSSVESIEEYAFNGCSALKNVEIPLSVNSIAENAFI